MKQTGKLDYLEMPATGGTLDSVKAFYSAAFSWSFTDYGPTYSAFDEGLDGGFQADAAEAPGKPLPVLYSENLEETLAAVESAGGNDRPADLLLPRRPALPLRRPGRQRTGGLGRIAGPRRRRRKWGLGTHGPCRPARAGPKVEAGFRSGAGGCFDLSDAGLKTC